MVTGSGLREEADWEGLRGRPVGLRQRGVRLGGNEREAVVGLADSRWGLEVSKWVVFAGPARSTVLLARPRHSTARRVVLGSQLRPSGPA